MTKSKFIYLLFISTIFSCKNSSIEGIVPNASVIEFSTFPKEERIAFNNIFEYKEGDPRSIHVMDSLLIIANKNNNCQYFFYKYSLIDNNLSEGFLRKGRGPNEAIGVSTTGIFKGQLWAYDITMRKLQISDIKNLDGSTKPIPFKDYAVGDSYFKVTLGDNLNVYGKSLFNKVNCKVETVNLMDGEKINELGEFYKVPNNVDIRTIKDAYAGEIVIKPTGDKIAVAYNFSDCIEIYNLNTGEQKVVQGPEVFDVSFIEKRRKDHYYMGKTKESKSAFVNATVTDNYIYLIYSGNTRTNRSEEARYKWSNGNYIFVFDWNGNPVKRITLDRHIQSLGVSKDDKTFYSFDSKTGYVIKAGNN